MVSLAVAASKSRPVESTYSRIHKRRRSVRVQTDEDTQMNCLSELPSLPLRFLPGPPDISDSARLRRGSAAICRAAALPVIVMLLLTSPAGARKPARAGAKAEKLARSVTIYRDTYGVPHIYGPTDASCIFGYAYAQAEDNFRQIEDSYIHALGRAAEIGGEKELPSDLLNRALEIPRLSQEEYQRATGRTREIADSF